MGWTYARQDFFWGEASRKISQRKIILKNPKAQEEHIP
jgi:hypothetical protein